MDAKLVLDALIWHSAFKIDEANGEAVYIFKLYEQEIEIRAKVISIPGQIPFQYEVTSFRAIDHHGNYCDCFACRKLVS